jgi:hypothetical protein
VGGDTLALAEIAPVVGIDLDEVRLAMASANLRACGLDANARLVQANLLDALPLPSRGDLGLFFDPARRVGDRRAFSVTRYQPPLAIVNAWLQPFPALGVKLSPGVKLDEVEPFDAELEFISLRGELKEAVLWFGPMKTASRRATLLPAGHSLVAPAVGTEGMNYLPVSHPLEYFYEPDPAVLRAGLVRVLGNQIGASQLDPEIAYLTSSRYHPTPFARAWKVEAWMPFNLKRLRAWLRQRGIGRVVVKKRGSPLTPEGLIRDLRLKGDGERVLFLTQCQGEPVVAICSLERATGESIA